MSAKFGFVSLSLLAIGLVGCRSPSDDAQASFGAPTDTEPAAGDVVGRWIIDPNLSAKLPPGTESNANKAAQASDLELTLNGKYREDLMGLETSGTYIESGGQVTLTMSNSPGHSSPEIYTFDKEQGTLTFSSGRHRVVFVRPTD